MLIHNRLALFAVTSVIVLASTACGGKAPPGNGTPTQDAGTGIDASIADVGVTDSGRPRNPLIDVLAGTWVNVVPGTGSRNIVTVDPDAPTCNHPGHEIGDACVRGFPPWSKVLKGNRLFLRTADGDRSEGRVLADGRRVEYENTWVHPPPGGSEQLAYEKVQ